VITPNVMWLASIQWCFDDELAEQRAVRHQASPRQSRIMPLIGVRAGDYEVPDASCAR
jgi:hypothetical protein